MTSNSAQVASNPRVTMWLTEAETRHYIRNHSGHLTYAAARRIIGELLVWLRTPAAYRVCAALRWLRSGL